MKMLVVRFHISKKLKNFFCDASHYGYEDWNLSLYRYPSKRKMERKTDKIPAMLIQMDYLDF